MSTLHALESELNPRNSPLDILDYLGESRIVLCYFNESPLCEQAVSWSGIRTSLFQLCYSCVLFIFVSKMGNCDFRQIQIGTLLVVSLNCAGIPILQVVSHFGRGFCFYSCLNSAGFRNKLIPITNGLTECGVYLPTTFLVDDQN